MKARLNWEKLIECVKDKDPAMFKVYKRIGWFYALESGNAEDFDEMFQHDEKVFRDMKNLISDLVLVKPSERMKLIDARRDLSNLLLSLSDEFLLLKERF